MSPDHNFNDSQKITQPALGLSDLLVGESVARSVRRKIPERVTNAKGSGAFGTFTVTHDISNYCKSSLFSKIGTKCRVFTRFSTMHGEKGSSDAERDLRGFSLRFYTEEGHWDLVGNNLPVFFTKEAQHFSEYMRAQSPDASTNLRSAAKKWDFYSAHPESLHVLLMLMSGRGVPANFREMHGYGTHTFSLINRNSERFWVKFHLISQQGAHAFNGGSAEHNFAHIDLLSSINTGNFPKWTLAIQVMTTEEAKTSRWNPFDVTKVWLHEDFPLIEVGEIELNEIPTSYFDDVEQAALSPANTISGIGLSPDKILQARLFSYADAQRHRLGLNAEQLPVNQDFSSPKYHAMDDVAQSISFKPDQYDNEGDHYTQPGLFYSKVLNDAERQTLIKNIVEEMQQIEGSDAKNIINRQLCHLFRANIELGMKVATGLQVNIDANMMSHSL